MPAARARGRNASSSASTAVAAGPRDPSSDSGNPTTMVVAPTSTAASMIAWWSAAVSAARPSVRSGLASVPVASLDASPIRTLPRSTPSARVTWSRVPDRAHRGGQRGERLVERVDVLAPADGEVGLLAGATAEHRRRVARDVGRRHASGRARSAERHHDAGVRAVGTEPDQPDDRVAADIGPNERVARRDRQRAQLRAHEPVVARHDDTVDRGRGEPFTDRARLLRALGRELSPQGAYLVVEPSDLVRELGRRDAQRRGQVAQLHFLVVDAVERDIAGDRLDAPEVRADRTLTDDLDGADEAERVHVGAAAQLDRVCPSFEDTHEIAVLVAEERDRAELLGFRLRHLVVTHRRVGDDLAVGERLDLVELRLRERLVVAEVEAQVLG